MTLLRHHIELLRTVSLDMPTYSGDEVHVGSLRLWGLVRRGPHGLEVTAEGEIALRDVPVHG